MPIPDFQQLSLAANLVIFGAAAVVVWIAGTRLAYYADAISERTKLSKVVLGLILLGVATSLPEIVTPITAATDESGVFAATVGLVATCIYLLGLLEQRDRTFLRMGYDSVAVLVAHSSGLVGLYFLK